jgi:AcrR family transcriptional regulator
MRKVAAALGAGTMSLYNYVPRKQHLYDLMLDAVAGKWSILLVVAAAHGPIRCTELERLLLAGPAARCARCYPASSHRQAVGRLLIVITAPRPGCASHVARSRLRS